MKHVVIIGAGFSGLASSCYLAKAGYKVTIVEKNHQVGGRARILKQDGFRFDMGPSWYWMPDIIEEFFGNFGKDVTEYFSLTRLDPSYRVFFGPDEHIDVPASRKAQDSLFEKIEPGSSQKIHHFLQRAKRFYQLGMYDYTRRPSNTIFELFDFRGIWSTVRYNMLGSLGKEIEKTVRDERLRKILKFPVLFLGADADKLPAMYSLMNHTDLELGTWYPNGGFHTLAEAMGKLAHELGVEIKLSSEVIKLVTVENSITVVETPNESIEADIVVASCDYHHAEQKLLPPKHQRYDQKYWQKQVMAPSAQLFFLGLNRQLPNLEHHNLLFDEPFEQHMKAIYDTEKTWAQRPLMYVNVPSKTDPESAPAGKENLFILIPTAPGLTETSSITSAYFDFAVQKIETYTGVNILPHIEVRKDYAMSNFEADYHSYKGNAYGLANTLNQTGPFKPKMKSTLTNLYYTGQLTVPGPGVPPAIISGEVVSKLIKKEHG